MIFLKFRINKKSSFGQELITQSSYFFIAKHNCDGTNWIWGWSELNLIVHNTEFGWLIQFLSLFNRIFYPESFLVRLLLKFVSVNWSNSICTVHSIWKKINLMLIHNSNSDIISVLRPVFCFYNVFHRVVVASFKSC